MAEGVVLSDTVRGWVVKFRFYEFDDVKAHDIPSVRQLLDTSRDREPRMIEAGESDAEVVETRREDREGGESCPQIAADLRRLGDVARRGEATDCAANADGRGFSRAEALRRRGGTTDRADNADGRGTGRANGSDGHENARPVTVNVNVNGGGGDGKASTTKVRRHEGDGKALAAIRKKTDLIPCLVEKVDATPGRTAALLSSNGRRAFGTFGTVVEEGFAASAHFTNLSWGGNQYVIRGSAAGIVEALYIAVKVYGLPGLRQDEVFAQIYGSDKKKWPSGNVRIQNFFRTGDAKHLWDAGFIRHDGKGSFHLNAKIHTHTQ